MYKITFTLFFTTVIALISLSFKTEIKHNYFKDEVDVENLELELVLENLGKQKSNHFIGKLDLEKAEIGRQIIFKGKAKTKNHKGKPVSSSYKCTDCHSVQKENETTLNQSPEARLEYAEKNNLPYFPASSLWGVYNRTSWYTGDYVKKYGDRIKNAGDSLTRTIQVCAKYASTGRFLEDWEVEGVLHYFKQNELKIKDIAGLSQSDKKNILHWQKLDREEKAQLREKIEHSFVQANPSTFVPTLSIDKRKFGEGGNPVKGEQFFSRSCLHCHGGKIISNFGLDKGTLTANMFLKNIREYNKLSLYQIIRWGTYSEKRKKQFMPLYTKEKMSDQQIEDLVAYIKQISKK